MAAPATPSPRGAHDARPAAGVPVALCRFFRNSRSVSEDASTKRGDTIIVEEGRHGNAGSRNMESPPRPNEALESYSRVPVHVY